MLIYNHLKLFLKAIWRDIRIEPKEIMPIFITIIVLSIIVMIPVISLAYLLSWIVGKPMNEGAYEASIGIFMVIFGIILVVSYIKKKWKECLK